MSQKLKAGISSALIAMLAITSFSLFKMVFRGILKEDVRVTGAIK